MMWAVLLIIECLIVLSCGGEYIPEGGEYADKSIRVPEYSPGLWRVAEMISLLSVTAIVYVCFAGRFIREKVHRSFVR